MAGLIKNFSDMVPDQDATIDLGSSDLRFKEIYALDFTLSNNPFFSSLTNGSVIFSGNNGEISQNNDNFKWRDAAKQLQIGPDGSEAGSSATPLAITGDDDAAIQIALQNTNTGAYTGYVARADNDVGGLLGHFVEMGIAGSTFDGTANGNIETVSVNNGGVGYAVDDSITITEGDYNCNITVLTVGEGGVVETVEIEENGSGYVVGTNFATVTTGSGVGCTMDITAIIDATLDVPGAGYIYCSGGHLSVGTDVDEPIIFHTNGYGESNEIMRIDEDGVGIGVTAPTARLHLPASSATANTASIKIDPGVVATVPVSGNVESNGTHLYWTDSSNARWQLDHQVTSVYSEVVSGSGTDFTLADTPIAGSVRLYGIGQRLTPTIDFTISGAVITTVNSWSANDIFADYDISTVSNSVYSEVVSGSGTTFTLAASPITGTVQVYGIGQRLIPTTDFTIVGDTITTVNSWSAGDILADYLT